MSVAPSQDTPRTVISAGLDWVTVTGSSDSSRAALIAIGRQLVADEMARGNKSRPIGGHGYQGMGAGQAAWGAREADALVTLTGSAAFLYGQSVLQLGTHASRVDAQITVHELDRDPQVIIWDARYHPSGEARRGAPIARRIVDDSRLGRTAYVGSPRSMQMGRVYDKHRESPKAYPRGAIRYEVQYRRTAADQWRGRAAAEGLGRDHCLFQVVGWFAARGVPTGVDVECGTPLATPPAAPSDYRRALRWWAASVAPSVRRWLTESTREEIAEALGIREGW